MIWSDSVFLILLQLPFVINNWARASSESSSKRVRVLTGSPAVESWNFEKRKLEMENIFSLVCMRVKINILPAYKSYGWMVVRWDYNVSSAPFVSELRWAGVCYFYRTYSVLHNGPKWHRFRGYAKPQSILIIFIITPSERSKLGV